jgi:hypothetical protein
MVLAHLHLNMALMRAVLYQSHVFRFNKCKKDLVSALRRFAGIAAPALASAEGLSPLAVIVRVPSH